MRGSEPPPAGGDGARGERAGDRAGGDRARGRDGYELRDLAVAFRTRNGLVPVVGGASLSALPGRITGVAGESGSGKTTTVLAGIGFTPPGAVRTHGDATLSGDPLLDRPREELRRMWATRISYVAQDAARALNPTYRIGGQIEEVLRVGRRMKGAAARTRVIELLRAVHLPRPEAAVRRYPHEFSGGQLQRIAIAMAIACDPELVIFDEPTTGLDVTTQAEVIGMLGELIRERSMAAIYISHDLALLAAISDVLVVFYAGEVVESGPTSRILAGPRHPYTRALLDALPSARRPLRPRGIPGLPPGRVVPDACAFADRCTIAIDACRDGHPPLEPTGDDGWLVRCIRARDGTRLESTAAARIDDRVAASESIMLRVRDLVCAYGREPARTVALDGVSLDIGAGEVVALVGESGSGKTTLGRALVGIVQPVTGTMTLDGEPLANDGTRTRRQRRAVQIIFQSPDASLNPRRTVGQLVRRPIELFRDDVPAGGRDAAVAEALVEVQLDPAVVTRYPHELSGGQKQRVAIAQAFVARPRLIVCDEIISGQDVSVQATILELVRTMQQVHGTALLFISHDLAAVRSIAQHVYVIRDGRIRESGPARTVFEEHADPYTRALLAAVMEPREALAGPA